MRNVPVYQILAEDIKGLGVDSVFGLMSDDICQLVATLDAIGVRFIGARQETNAVMMAALLDKVRSGNLKPVIYRRFDFAQAADALNLLAGRKVIGKCILVSERGRAESAKTPGGTEQCKT